MSIQESLNKIEEYNDLYESEKGNMTELERLILSPSAMNFAASVLMAINASNEVSKNE